MAIVELLLVYGTKPHVQDYASCDAIECANRSYNDRVDYLCLRFFEFNLPKFLTVSLYCVRNRNFSIYLLINLRWEENISFVDMNSN